MFRLAALFSQGFGCIEQRYAARQRLFVEVFLNGLWLFFNPVTEHIGRPAGPVSCQSSIWWRSRWRPLAGCGSLSGSQCSSSSGADVGAAVTDRPLAQGWASKSAPSRTSPLPWCSWSPPRHDRFPKSAGIRSIDKRKLWCGATLAGYRGALRRSTYVPTFGISPGDCNCGFGPRYKGSPGDLVQPAASSLCCRRCHSL